MALTKITGQVINTATDVTVGVLTVTNTLSVGGTVSVGGTLTYEDVTNVDSVGLITARGGVFVSAGSSIGIGSATPTADIEVHTSSNTLGILSSTDGGANLDLFDDDTQSRIRTTDGRLHLYSDFGNSVADSSIRFFVDGSNEKVRIKSNGNVGIGTTLPQSSVDVNGTAIVKGATVNTGSINMTSSHLQFSGQLSLPNVGATLFRPVADTIAFGINNGQRVSVNQHGLLFGTDTAAANALNDYEEGDWTPALSQGSPTYVTQVGKYTKIGEIVFCSFYLDYSNGSSGSQRITGLPFTPDASREGVTQVSRLGSAFNEDASAGSRFMHSISFTSQGTTRIYVDLIISVAARGVRGTFQYRAA